MEPLWSPVVATGGRRSQIEQARGPPKQAKTVAVGCDQLPFGAHGKEGVDGSSPSEGSAKAPQRGFVFGSTCRFWNVARYGALYPRTHEESGRADAARTALARGLVARVRSWGNPITVASLRRTPQLLPPESCHDDGRRKGQFPNSATNSSGGSARPRAARRAPRFRRSRRASPRASPAHRR